jgi:hypothetical protein
MFHSNRDTNYILFHYHNYTNCLIPLIQSLGSLFIRTHSWALENIHIRYNTDFETWNKTDIDTTTHSEDLSATTWLPI